MELEMENVADSVAAVANNVSTAAATFHFPLLTCYLLLATCIDFMPLHAA